MPIEVKMAKLSPTMESGRLVRWLVKVGDKVKEGQTLAEIETDKATMPMEAFDDGVVAHLDLAEGDEAPLGARVLVLAKKNEDAQKVGEEAKKGSAGGAKPAAAAAPAQSKQAEGGNGNGHGAPTATATAEAAPGGRLRTSPLARKIAGLRGVDLHRVKGTGPNGRIVRRDVEEFLASGGAEQAPAAASGAPAVAAKADEKIPLSRMRATIAKRMSDAWAVPVVHLTVDIRLDRVMEIREQLNKQLAAEKIKLSVGDFITKAVAMTLRRNPELNASFVDGAIIRHGRVNVGIAVALENGLIVPVLQDADALGLKAIRQGTEALAKAARDSKLSPEQLGGGTFTISNLGMFGTKQFDAILNLPQVGILAVGAGEQRPVVEGGQLVIGTVMSATITADHRAVDGADAARFLQALKGYLEEPATMLI